MSKAEYQRQWKTQNKEHVASYHKAYSQRWYKENPDRYVLYSARARAKKLGLPFDLDLSDIQIPSVCPILGIELSRNTGGNRPLANSPSLDRIVPEKGYVKGNVQVISQRANIMKNDASPEELKRFADWVNQSIH